MSRFCVAADVVVDVATIVIGAVSLAIGSWVILADSVGATPEMVRLVELINTVVRVSIAGTIVLTAINAALELRRLIRMSRSAPGAASAGA